MVDLIYKDLSYKITGLIFEIDNIVGYGHSEKTYGDAFEKLLKRDSIKYVREIYFPLKLENEIIKKYYFDFLIEDKIVVELKANDHNYKEVCFQVYAYLRTSDKKLGIVYRFTRNGVKHKRIVNFD